MRSLNLHHLRYFWAIAHEGSLTRAAAKLHLSQSALSTQLKKLEEQVGHPLFERLGKRLILTEAGRIALDYADTIFQAGEELLSTLQGRPSDSQQVLRVGAITTLSRNFQIEFLGPLVGRTDVELIIRSGTMRELLSELESLTIDVVLTNSDRQLDASTTLVSRLLRTQPVSLVGGPRLKKKRFRYPDDLRTVPILLPSVESEIRVAFDRELTRHGIEPIVLAEVDDMAMLRLLARESDGVTLVPPIVVKDELAAGILVEHCRIPNASEHFYAITQRRRFPNPLLLEVLSLET
ncbi:LysR family transcriptional regulator [Methyloceanibacter caenitepidi]|uniref:Hydrogen peroxide-inducible genes activator n=1 Tax=Methyloceanibacter caenitepidi TaxID=1384459 RepID=A0A0A8K4L7_9HYPH|nr:LysR family transcriptional regulator [Methyloceanibacter caenitepidi]BAQ17487.1 hydrogen peroxide-inducible genes activator [Methyloceanibacter caenitepidi]